VIAASWNLRDLGGGIGLDGRPVRTGHVFRSAAPDAASGSGPTFGAAIRYVIDMRTDREREREPAPVLSGIEIWSRDYVTSSADLCSHLIDGPPRPERLRQVMLDSYAALPGEQAAAIAAMFSAIAQGHFPLLVHCAVGKDRTGVASALLLSALGVAEEAILEDYLRSNASADRIVERLLVHPLLSADIRSRPEALAPLARADAEYLAAMFAALKTEHGTVDGYLDRVVGVDAGMLERIRDTLLE
jgi:protein-tyrosine phosphatase